MRIVLIVRFGATMDAGKGDRGCPGIRSLPVRGKRGARMHTELARHLIRRGRELGACQTRRSVRLNSTIRTQIGVSGAVVNLLAVSRIARISCPGGSAASNLLHSW